MVRMILITVMMTPVMALANEYPTAETVRMVVACMAEFGEQNEENLITCSCKQDVFEAEISFHDYEQASLFERYVRMPGKRGGRFRDSKPGKEYIKKLKNVRKKANESCPVVKKITRETVKK